MKVSLHPEWVREKVRRMKTRTIMHARWSLVLILIFCGSLSLIPVYGNHHKVLLKTVPLMLKNGTVMDKLKIYYWRGNENSAGYLEFGPAGSHVQTMDVKISPESSCYVKYDFYSSYELGDQVIFPLNYIKRDTILFASATTWGFGHDATSTDPVSIDLFTGPFNFTLSYELLPERPSFVVPEYPLGSIMALSAFLMAFMLVRRP